MIDWQILYSHKAARYIENLRPESKDQIRLKIEKLLDDYSIGRPLFGKLKRFRRLRVGKIRILYKVNTSDKIIYIAEVGPRGDIYK